MFEYHISNEVSLRPFQKKYQQDLYELVQRNKDFLGRWLFWANEADHIDKLDKFCDYANKLFTEGRGYSALIYYKGSVAGVIVHQEYNKHSKQLSLGYWLGEEFTGKGVMTKACRAMIDYAFKELTCHRVEIRCAEENYASRAIPERLGFVQEGILRHTEELGGQYVNHVVYGILEDEWNMDA